jgi:hypothetical protein
MQFENLLEAFMPKNGLRHRDAFLQAGTKFPDAASRRDMNRISTSVNLAKYFEKHNLARLGVFSDKLAPNSTLG